MENVFTAYGDDLKTGTGAWLFSLRGRTRFRKISRPPAAAPACFAEHDGPMDKQALRPLRCGEGADAEPPLRPQHRRIPFLTGRETEALPSGRADFPREPAKSRRRPPSPKSKRRPDEGGSKKASSILLLPACEDSFAAGETEVFSRVDSAAKSAYATA